MKRIAIGLAATLALAACGGGGTTTQATATPAPTTAAPTPTPTPSTTVVLTATLLPTEEVPPITSAEASCSGTATVTLNKATNSGTFAVEVKGCPATTEINIMHIHRGAKGANGGVVVNSGLVAGEWKLTAGAGTITKNIATIDAALLNEIATSPAGFYFNLHSTLHAPGVIRGQLALKS
ncbi:MAG TPA: CHRD domain-containing protein [Candidatus Limnocylindria bacterium]|nr:CHRD domain-containing protein [Candidatus Limnocylindria bacterium]